MKILVAEDDFLSRTLLLKQLAEFGQADVVVNGKEAVQAVEMKIREGDPYRLICLDIMMPEMSGNEALKAIRELERSTGFSAADRSKIIMTTSLGGSGDILNSFRDECDGYLVKPIKMQDLKKLMGVLNLDVAS